jgi:hypothetical protein
MECLKWENLQKFLKDTSLGKNLTDFLELVKNLKDFETAKMYGLLYFKKYISEGGESGMGFTINELKFNWTISWFSRFLLMVNDRLRGRPGRPSSPNGPMVVSATHISSLSS